MDIYEKIGSIIEDVITLVVALPLILVTVAGPILILLELLGQ